MWGTVGRIAALGVGGTAALSRNDGFRDFIRQSEKDAAKNEEFDRTADAGERIERRGLETWGDKFFGRDPAKIEAEAQKRSNKAILGSNTIAAPLAELTATLRSQKRLDLVPTLGDNETSAEFGARIGEQSQVLSLQSQASEKGIDVSDLSNPTSDQLRRRIADQDAGGTKQILARQQAKDAKEEGWRRFTLEREDQRLAADRAERESRQTFNEQENRADRAHQTQLAMMDRQDKMADRRYMRERDTAKDRQQSIMMMMKGLAQLGAGFAL